jgi:hypothetical protein
LTNQRKYNILILTSSQSLFIRTSKSTLLRGSGAFKKGDKNMTKDMTLGEARNEIAMGALRNAVASLQAMNGVDYSVRLLEITTEVLDLVSLMITKGGIPWCVKTESEGVSVWINPTDQLPEEYKPLVLYYKDAGICMGSFDSAGRGVWISAFKESVVPDMWMYQSDLEATIPMGEIE